MMTQQLVNELIRQVEDELGGQVRALALIDAQETAIKKGAVKDVVSTTASVEAELKQAAVRGRKRSQLLRKLARSWGVAAESLTLSSIVERARHKGLETGKLESLRGELRSTVAQVVKRSRRMNALARASSQILHEAIETALKNNDPAASAEGGALVNAEA